MGVAYGSDVSHCLALLLKIAREHPKVLFYPEPSSYFVNFGASSLDLILRFWVREYNDAMAITSDILLKINDVFTAEGIEISFPQLDVHMHNDDEVPLPAVVNAAESAPADAEEKKETA